ncbi:MAG TPA: RES family NAD+ phosphorylase [Terriglobales bacterium]|nr:RES family NAD+ phosphorylase [Terriglobales bacterium]
MPITSQIDQRDTHRLIPAQYADGGASVLTRLSDDEAILEGIFELDNATNDRLLTEAGLSPIMGSRGLVFGIPSYRIINAAFCHRAPAGSQFNSADRGAWYAAFELVTSQTEVAYHKQLWLQETAWEQAEVADYVDYLADFRAEFHDIRGSTEHGDCLAPDSYAASQALAAQLLNSGSAGIVYPSVRHHGGTCIACFRPVLVINVRRGNTFTFVFPDSMTPPTIHGG